MTKDALDHTFKPFGKKARHEYAKKKAREENNKFFKDRKQVEKNASLFRETIERQMREAGIKC